MSDIDTVVVDSLKALDPNRPIREADKRGGGWIVRYVPIGDIARLILNEEGRQLRRPFVALTD